MRILQIVPSLEHEASGPSYSVPRLAEALARRGHDVSLFSAGGLAVSVDDAVRRQRFRRDFERLPGLKALQFSQGLHAALRDEVPRSDIVHSNGLWVMSTLYPAWAARRSGTPMVCSPRGTLSPIALAKSPLRKRIFWRAVQRQAVNRAAILHATSEREYADIRSFGLTQPVAVIPIGIDLPPEHVRPSADPRRPRRLLYLGRLHPIKGVEALIRAWAVAAAQRPEWEFRLVGPGEATYIERLKAVVRETGAPRVVFAGPAYGEAKHDEYRQADLYVLPSLTENFGVSVAEALSHGLPVITTTGTPWGEVEARNCGWCVDPEIEPLGDALGRALGASPSELEAMGARGRAWMQDAFSWDKIAEETEAVYHWTVNGGATPQSVRCA